MRREDVAAVGKAGERALPPGDGDARIEGKGAQHRTFHVGRGIDEGPVHDHASVCGRRVAERVARDVADVAVALGLHPGPAFTLVVDRHRLPVEQLRRQAGVRTRMRLQIGQLGHDARRPPLDEAGPLDHPAQARRCEVGPRRCHAAIVSRPAGAAQGAAAP